MNDKSGLEQLLDQLDHWRNFAAYKLEQRIDPLIGMCLPKIIEGYIGREIFKNIIPEFPFPTEILMPENDEKRGSLRCDRIDYAAFCADKKILYLIELKTDATSVSLKQLDKLQAVAVKSENSNLVNKWMEGLIKVANSSSKPRKYIPIFYELKKWDLFGSINGVIDAATKDIDVGLKNNLGKLIPKECCKEVTITPVLIAPKECFEKIDENKYDRIIRISLSEAAAELSGGDEMQSLLKTNLEWWDNPENSVIPSDDYLRGLKCGG